MTEHEIPEADCPECGYTADRASGTWNDEVPKVGDIVICINCGAQNEFTEHMFLRPLDKSRVCAEQQEHMDGISKLIIMRGRIVE